jgi:hypothetical protein
MRWTIGYWTDCGSISNPLPIRDDSMRSPPVTQTACTLAGTLYRFPDRTDLVPDPLDQNLAHRGLVPYEVLQLRYNTEVANILATEKNVSLVP